ncbi:RsmB/NOP family class I SAM-dependent RNA methyltransferase [Desertibaculum subflavum]|uniref:RsmB/NOP family class I SAM-dependent RNA methyltransferase n=1 Tax=Desertibaculum subflavum TaxID=2268458 RepID=UPI000E675259
MTSDPPTARDAARRILSAVLERGRPLDEAWAAALAPDAPLTRLSERDRAFTRLLVATSLRRKGEIDAVLARCIAKPLPPKAGRERTALQLGVAQLLHLGTPAHAAVGETVALVGEASPYRALVNAVLRRVAREPQALVADLDAAHLNTPEWLWQRWCKEYGEAATRRIAAQHMADPPLDITAKENPGNWAEQLGAALLPTGTLRRPHAGAVEQLPGFAEGAWWVQDAAAALPARLLGDVSGKRVIDLCAAPGGKTAQLAAAGARVTAVEKSSARAQRLQGNLRRLKLEAEIVVGDATAWRPGDPADAVLLDAPCSATGTARRHPDVPHLKRPDDLVALTAFQDALLAAAGRMVRPGGMLVYAVCSLEPEEGRDRIAALLSRDGAWARLPLAAAEIGGHSNAISAEGDLRTLPGDAPDPGGWDGFYAARLQRR